VVLDAILTGIVPEAKDYLRPPHKRDQNKLPEGL